MVKKTWSVSLPFWVFGQLGAFPLPSRMELALEQLIRPSEPAFFFFFFTGDNEKAYQATLDILFPSLSL